jgi:hypothetical protein
LEVIFFPETLKKDWENAPSEKKKNEKRRLAFMLANSVVHMYY